MKKLYTIVIFLLIATTLLAQPPASFKYQAVLRDNRGNVKANTEANIIIDILQGSPTGITSYRETHKVTTDSYGLINIEIGKGTSTIGTLSGIDWSAGPYFIKVTVDGLEMGTSQLLSVPYALYAKTAGNGFSGSYNDLTAKPPLFDGTWSSLTGKPAFANVATSGSYNDLANKPVIFSGDYASLTGKPTLSLVASTGSYTSLLNKPVLFDGTWTNLSGKPTGNSSGDLQYWNGTEWVLLPRGNTGQVLSISSSGIPFWQNASAANLLAPTAITLSATNVQTFPALNATVNANGLSTTVIFEWGLTTDYGTEKAVYGIDSYDMPGTYGVLTGNINVAISITPGYFQSASTYHYRIKATNSVNVTYGTDMTFTTTLMIPQVTTMSPPPNYYQNITMNSFSSGGGVRDDGGAPITARGVCWSTAASPTLSDSFTNDGSGVGSFTSNISGLDPKTSYYVRAYATNSIGTSYGNEEVFTTLTDLPSGYSYDITSIGATSASITSSIYNYGASTVTARGVCWSTTTNPTIADSKTSDGSGTGEIVSTITGLTLGITYYVRAYATNSVGTSYSFENRFTTISVTLPTVTTTAAGNITQTTAASGGNVNSNGGASVTAQGVCWSISANPTIADSKTNGVTDPWGFSSSIVGLTASTSYYIRAYATNSAGTGYGNQISLITAAVALPVVNTSIVSEITKITAKSGGNVTGDGGATVISRGVCWSTTANPTVANSKTIDNAGRGAFTSSITGLIENTIYFVRSYATNSVGTVYGNEISFITTSALIGQPSQGGVIAYVLQTSDPGYVAGETHGLIAAPGDQSIGIQWYNGSSIVTGAIATELGQGNSNTNLIVSSQGPGNYAAKLCFDLDLGGYTDWYLPSKDELEKLYSNRIAIGGFGNFNYWSSTESYNVDAWYHDFQNGSQSPYYPKSLTLHVRAVRSF